MVNNGLSMLSSVPSICVTGNRADGSSPSLLEPRRPALTAFGLRYAAVMSSIARRDRSSLSKAMRELPQGMKHIRRSSNGLTGLLAAMTSTGHQSITIHQSEHWRLGVVRLGPAAKIPLHDHPDAFSVSHVLAGRIRIDAFSSVDHLRGMVRLHRAWTVDLGPEESAVLDPWSVNIHRVEASDHGAVLLSGIFSNRSKIKGRHWFFPLGQLEQDTVEAAVVNQDSFS